MESLKAVRVLRRAAPSFAMVLCASFPPVAIAQSIRGRVADGSTDRPIPLVVVELLTAERGVVARARTGEDGTYEVKAPGAGQYRLRFQRPGYRPLLSEPFDLLDTGSLELSPTLAALPPPMLDTIVVYGEAVPRYLEDFYRRRRMGFGTFLTKGELDRIWPRRVSDLTSRLRGFVCRYDQLGNCRISSARSWRGFCPALTFLDGIRVGDTSSYDIDMIPPEWIVAIETYGSVAFMPQEFNVTGAACGVVALWTVR